MKVARRHAAERRSEQWPLLVAGALLLALGAGAWQVLSSLSDVSPPAPPTVQQISIVQPPPPPPPPPPEVVKPPPEKIEPVAAPEPAPAPEPTPEQPPNMDQLGLDADGTAGSDGFGLQARRGGRELSRGGGGSAVIWYGQKLGAALGDALRAALSERINARGFTITAALWVAADGRVSRAELLDSSGDMDTDKALHAALATVDLRLPQAPPSNMPQPIRIRVRARS